MQQYLKLFNFLWRLKRVEHDLSTAWRRNMTSARSLYQIKKVKKEIITSRLVCSEMIHFVYQLQYYILFEVIECSWDELVTDINKKSGDLDSLIEAHNKYLTNVTTKSFLGTSNNQDELHNFALRDSRDSDMSNPEKIRGYSA
ncbi:6457_t:CDS:2, partial [Funneliformis mosseae]